MTFTRTFALSCLAVAVAAAPQASSITEDVSTTAMPTGLAFPLTFPGGLDTQALVGSVISESNGVATIDVTCPEGTDSNDCGFFPDIVVTAGPTTLALTMTGGADSEESLTYTYVQECSFAASAGGVCTFTAIDVASDIFTDESSIDTATATGLYTTTYTSDVAAEELTAVNVVLTAGQTAALTGLATATASANTESSDLASGTSSRSRASLTATSTRSSSSSSSSGSASATAARSSSSSSSSNEAKALVPGAMAAGLMGLAAILL